MSAKAAMAEELRPGHWEAKTIARLKRLTDRPIVFRPKPNCRAARPIAGSTFAPTQPLDDALRDCHAVVTHHSNVAVDALLAGVPVFCESGVASVLGCADINAIEQPIMPAGRAQWAADLAWCQWNVQEMRDGLAYKYLLSEGLIR